MIIDFNGTVVDIDVKRTRKFYYSDNSVEIDCMCDGCRNYIKFCDVMPQEVEYILLIIVCLAVRLVLRNVTNCFLR